MTNRLFTPAPLAAAVASALFIALAADASQFAYVSVHATAPLATQPGNHPGAFTITRRGDTNSALTIPYELGGTATNGVDYQSIPTSVTLSPGQVLTNISITPITEPAATGHKTVALSLPHSDWRRNRDSNDFLVGIPGRAEVFIAYKYTNAPPSVSILSPTNGASFLKRPNISISALASDTNGWVTSAQFFANGHSIGTLTNGAYTRQMMAPSWPIRSRNRFDLVWSNAAPGSYALTVVATDNGGAQTTSSAVNVTVTTNVATPAAMIIAPPAGAQFPLGAAVTIFAAAGETNGHIDTVEFFGNGASLGVVTNFPMADRWYPEHRPPVWLPETWRWTNAPLGSNTIHVVATDANGLQAASAPVSFEVVTNFPTHHHRW